MTPLIRAQHGLTQRLAKRALAIEAIIIIIIGAHTHTHTHTRVAPVARATEAVEAAGCENLHAGR